MLSEDILNWAKVNSNIVWIDKYPWYLRNRMLHPVSLPHSKHLFNRNSIKVALRNSNAVLALWTDEWNTEKSDWWWTCCDDQNYDISLISNSNVKRAIRKGLMNCEVRKIESEEFTQLSYPIFFNSLISYNHSKSKIPSFEEYAKTVKTQSQYYGLELWGSFYENQLASYSTCIVLDGAVSLGSTKSNPEFHKYNANNALFYEIARYYLRERKLKYVTNGYRNLLHQTNINDFLIRMGFRKIYSRLNAELSLPLKIFLKSGIANISNKFLTHISRDFSLKITALVKFIHILKSFKE